MKKLTTPSPSSSMASAGNTFVQLPPFPDRSRSMGQACRQARPQRGKESSAYEADQKTEEGYQESQEEKTDSESQAPDQRTADVSQTTSGTLEFELILREALRENCARHKSSLSPYCN